MDLPNPETFTELIERVRSGEPAARAALFDRVAREDGQEGALLLGMARKLLPAEDQLRDYVESRDLVQSALRSGWIDLSDFRGETPAEFLAWMRSILRRKLAQVVRRRRPRKAAIAAKARPGDLGIVEQEPLAGLVRREVACRVREAVATLPEAEREAIELRLSGLKAPEIARRLGIQPGAVRKRESRAAARLRGLLKEYLAGSKRAGSEDDREEA